MIKGKIGVLTVFLLCLVNVGTSAQGRDCCHRFAIYSNCIVDNVEYGNKDGDIYCDSIRNWLIGLISRDCFHFKLPQVVDTSLEQGNPAGRVYRLKPTLTPENEYSFDVNLLSDLNEITDEGDSIRSSPTISMYFEGEQRELVHCWKTRKPGDTLSNISNGWLWLENELKSNYNEGSDIYEIIKDFEKKPTSCQIKLQKENVNINEVIEIELSDFQDAIGESSREFNRIIIHAPSGEIMNGEESYIGPDFKVFRVDDGTITVKYRAPDDNKKNMERITVFSSCDILPAARVPMSSAEIYEPIREITIGINVNKGKIKSNLVGGALKIRHNGDK
jgi:hypothetical protein